jgi:hypothetical protein
MQIARYIFVPDLYNPVKLYNTALTKAFEIFLLKDKVCCNSEVYFLKLSVSN